MTKRRVETKISVCRVDRELAKEIANYLKKICPQNVSGGRSIEMFKNPLMALSQRCNKRRSFLFREKDSQCAHYFSIFQNEFLSKSSITSRVPHAQDIITSSYVNEQEFSTLKLGKRCFRNADRGLIKNTSSNQLGCRHLTMDQNSVAKSPRAADQCGVNIHSPLTNHRFLRIEKIHQSYNFAGKKS
ncbi:hypothetical protein TNCV_4105741 [Trichonephila clavipes]|nr:hypothetical protein TNCV_4105741 [Trichonephila clavipes]